MPCSSTLRSRGQGIGQLLLHSFLATRSEATVDVNEQNAPQKAFMKPWALIRRDDRTRIQRVDRIRSFTCAGGANVTRLVKT